MRGFPNRVSLAVVVAFTAMGFAGRATADVKPLTFYATKHKSEFENILDKVDATPGNFRDKARKYDELTKKLKEKFVAERQLEYTAERQTTQTDNFEVERDHAGIGAPRRTSHNNRDVRAPENMVFDSLDWKERSAIGDVKKDHGISDGGKVVHLHIQARARSHGSGRSTIKTTPAITWRYEDPHELAENEWTELEALLGP